MVDDIQHWPPRKSARIISRQGFLDYGNLVLIELEVDNLPRLSFFARQMPLDLFFASHHPVGVTCCSCRTCSLKERTGILRHARPDRPRIWCPWSGSRTACGKTPSKSVSCSESANWRARAGHSPLGRHFGWLAAPIKGPSPTRVATLEPTGSPHFDQNLADGETPPLQDGQTIGAGDSITVAEVRRLARLRRGLIFHRGIRHRIAGVGADRLHLSTAIRKRRRTVDRDGQ